jgi:hypothetical protein
MPQEATFSGMESVKAPYVTGIVESSKNGGYTLSASGQLVE